MHILVVNDDGPPSNQSSPYVHSLVKTLQANKHIVSVILPHTQRSWIGKAHFVSQITKPTYFRPGTLHEDDGTIETQPLRIDESGEEWILVDGTPATCAQLGLYHFFQDRGPVDLVISGPNYGRNSTNLFCLSSGTVGGAMEAAVCGKRAIAISYAFYSREHDSEIIAEASRVAVKVVDYLAGHWGEDVDLYSVNVPLMKGVEGNKVMVTTCFQSTWQSGSSFQEVDPDEEDKKDPEEREKEIREKGEVGSSSKEVDKTEGEARHTHRHFKWAPKFADVHKVVKDSGPGYDGWTIEQGCTSVTPMKANFAQAQAHVVGELKLWILPTATRSKFLAHIDYGDSYVQPLILEALATLFEDSYQLLSAPLPDSDLVSDKPYLQITQYESLSHDALLSHPSYVGNAYTIRKALIRKHYLAHTIASYTPKHPDSLLNHHVPLTTPFELDYAEFMDDSLVEAWELHASWAKGEGGESRNREWWILKPGMSDRGQGIRLFSSEDELRAIFEEWEIENPEEEEEEEEEEEDKEGAADHEANGNIDTSSQTATSKLFSASDGLITSQLRHFVVQPYVPPLLLPAFQNRKFHIRSYVLCVGALQVYLYKPMLALFAEEDYLPPGTSTAADGATGLEEPEMLDMRRHLTNTCLQDGTRPGSVHKFWDLAQDAPRTSHILTAAFATICSTTADLFRAAAASPTTFQPLPNGFEIYGVDWLLDSKGTPWLLEVNAFPDFGQTGGPLRDVVGGLWKGALGIVGNSMLNLDEGAKVVPDEEMLKVLDLDLGRR